MKKVTKFNQNCILMFALLLLFLFSSISSTFQASGIPYDIGEYMDQSQDDINYGYWFDDTIIRHQEFKPLYSTLSRLDLYIRKDGNPGNVLINITDGQSSLWDTTLLEADIVNQVGWVNISMASVIPLVPGQSYFIHVRSDTPSLSTADRYFWSGQLPSNYTRGISSVSEYQPDFDFGFVTWSLSSDTSLWLDQAQDGDNYGFWFEESVTRSQEFKPLFTSLTRLDLNIQKNGNPGNMLVNITDDLGMTLWQTTVLEVDIVSGWVNISVVPTLPLIPGYSYFINVRSDTPSPTTTDRYFWDGHTASNYYRGTTTMFGWPNFDFAFRTWSVPEDTAIVLDQTQDAVNYGFSLDDSWGYWQEFTPLYTTLTQLDLYIQRTGDPGDMEVKITDDQNSLWNTTVLEANIATTGWISISVPSAVPLIQGNSYFINVRSVNPYDINHRYAWMGHITANYSRGISNEEPFWPGYDFAFRTYSLSGSPALYLDQLQENVNYGFAFTNTWSFWQEFKPLYTTLTQFDINIQRTGNPGNIEVNITDGQTILGVTTVFEADITTGWVNITLPSVISLIPGNSYFIHVRSQTPSDASNRYAWMGHTAANYSRGITSVESGLSGYDFAFRTWSLFCDRTVHVDQVQDGLNYGYWFEETVIRWQEFKPLYASLTQLDLYIQKNGNPGNMLVNITDGQFTLWQTTVLEADIAPTGWVKILVPSSLSLIPGHSYFIYVWSDSPSPNTANRYTWRGYLGSNYNRASVPDPYYPGYDFMFRTWGLFFDSVLPDIAVTSPNNSTFAMSDVWLNYTVDEPTSWIGYSLDGAANVTIMENTLLSSLSEGGHNVVIYATDSVGNMGVSDTVWFTIDTTAPSITLINPTSTTYDVTDVWLSFTVDEPTSWIGYSLDDTANVTISGDIQLTSLSEGSHSIIVYAEDTVGNMGLSTTVWFTIEIPVTTSSPTTTGPPTTTGAPTTTEDLTTTSPTSSSTTTAGEPGITSGFTLLIVISVLLPVLVLSRRRKNV